MAHLKGNMAHKKGNKKGNMAIIKTRRKFTKPFEN